jgi:hypothetical protein
MFVELKDPENETAEHLAHLPLGSIHLPFAVSDPGADDCLLVLENSLTNALKKTSGRLGYDSPLALTYNPSSESLTTSTVDFLRQNRWPLPVPARFPPLQ